jgi:hypothetical protein
MSLQHNLSPEIDGDMYRVQFRRVGESRWSDCAGVLEMIGADAAAAIVSRLNSATMVTGLLYRSHLVEVSRG